MSEDQHHHDALLETARTELGRAHQAAVAMSAADLRRGLQLALDALREAGSLPGGLPSPDVTGQVERALAELDSGQLADMERQLESARAALNV